MDLHCWWKCKMIWYSEGASNCIYIYPLAPEIPCLGIYPEDIFPQISNNIYTKLFATVVWQWIIETVHGTLRHAHPHNHVVWWSCKKNGEFCTNWDNFQYLLSEQRHKMQSIALLVPFRKEIGGRGLRVWLSDRCLLSMHGAPGLTLSTIK
jgi:hypothetical protein